LGVRSLVVRYPVSVVIAYLTFFVLIRLWLWYVGPAPGVTSSALWSREIIRSDFWSEPHGPGSSDSGNTDWSSDGGHSGSGGASGSCDVSGGHHPGGGSGSGSGSGFSFDLDGDGEGGCLFVIVLLLLLLLLTAILGAAIYLIYSAPTILAEAFFEALLASGLIRVSHRMSRFGWVGSVFKSTVMTFVVVLGLRVLSLMPPTVIARKPQRLSKSFRSVILQ